MANFYKHLVLPLFSCIFRISVAKNNLGFTVPAIILIVLISNPAGAQTPKVQLSYSYVNVTRNSGGGTLEKGDVIEIHALAKVNSTTSSFYYIDTIPSGTQFVSNSLKLVTNEGLAFSGSGPYTDASNDDAGVYASTGSPRVRVNIGTGFSPAQNGANFGLTTGGGTVSAGSVPKFYGSTLFMVSYRLLVTANNNDTIYPTGIFYFDTSGIARKFRFDYSPIKIIQNQALCLNYSSSSFSAESSFASGTAQNRALGATVPGYTKVNVGANSPQDNYYSIVNNSSATGATDNTTPYKPSTNTTRVFGGFWDIIGDHTNSTNTANGNLPVSPGTNGGYMLMVNAAFITSEVYRDTIRNLCPNTHYEFSAWVRNICGVCGINQLSAPTYAPGVLPNLSFTINDVDYYTTGNMLHNNKWEKRGFLYQTGPTETQFRITIKNNAPGGGGNDWVLDDINLATCYPDLVNSPKDTATACAGYSLTLSDTVKSYFNNYTSFCWEKSTNGTNWTSTGICGTKSPTLSNGQYIYVVDTTFTATAADSAIFYRLKVATTFSNLSNPNCSVTNSQKIFLKVYNVLCSTLDKKWLNLTGSQSNGYADLQWKISSEENLLSYILEKSTDGNHFFKVDSLVINPANLNIYSYRDRLNSATQNFYRIRLVSKTSLLEIYSRVVTVNPLGSSFHFTVKNPFASTLPVNIKMPERGYVTIMLFDSHGKQVLVKTELYSAGTIKYNIAGAELLEPGIYVLRMAYKNQVFQQKIIKLR